METNLHVLQMRLTASADMHDGERNERYKREPYIGSDSNQSSERHLTIDSIIVLTELRYKLQTLKKMLTSDASVSGCRSLWRTASSMREVGYMEFAS